MKLLFMGIILLLILTSLIGDTVYVPEDYGTIQGAINAVDDGDKVIIFPGTYVENINFLGKGILVGSLYHTTDDTCYIPLTIIDGNHNGSVVKFESGEDSTSILTGFTITNGYSGCGGGIICNETSPFLNNLHIVNNIAIGYGGGIYSFGMPEMEHVIISDNTASFGGGIYCTGSISLNYAIIQNNEADYGGGIYTEYYVMTIRNSVIRNNTYGIYTFDWGTFNLENLLIEDNLNGGLDIGNNSEANLAGVTIRRNGSGSSGCGLSIYCFSEVNFSSENRCNIYDNGGQGRGRGCDIQTNQSFVNVIVDTFTVMNPTEHQAYPLEDFTFDILHGKNIQVSADLYVSPDGINTNSGTSIFEPLRTIGYAGTIILPDSLNPLTIYLAPGTYSPSSNGETFPISIPDYVSLAGAGETSVILDAENSGSVIYLSRNNDILISGMTLKNGYGENGGGICIYNSSLKIENVIITDNTATFSGGGIFCHNSAITDLSNSIISNNTAEEYNGGGFYCSAHSEVNLSRVLIAGNTAGSEGGGINFHNRCKSTLYNVTLADNEAGECGGGLSGYGSHQTIGNCIIWDNEPDEVYLPEIVLADTVIIFYTTIQGGYWSIETGPTNWVFWLGGNFIGNPDFENTATGNYYLLEESPCIDGGTAYFGYNGEVLLNMCEDEYYGSAPDMGAFEYTGVRYGDINDNGLVDSYDAALLLMYVVGLDPLPEDPLPWAGWRIERADVNLSGDIGALDAAYILQYTVGIIENLPASDEGRAFCGEIEISHDEYYIYLKSRERIISLSCLIKSESHLVTGRSEIMDETAMFFRNGTRFALISAEGIGGELVRIPYQVSVSGEKSISFEFEVNGRNCSREYHFEEQFPQKSMILSIYPNPFNPETTISFFTTASLRGTTTRQAEGAENIELNIYNLKGQQVRGFREDETGNSELGIRTVVWDGRDDLGKAVASGIYLVRLRAGDESSSRKILLLK